jgi:hypothetical protein
MARNAALQRPVPAWSEILISIKAIVDYRSGSDIVPLSSFQHSLECGFIGIIEMAFVNSLRPRLYGHLASDRAL